MLTRLFGQARRATFLIPVVAVAATLLLASLPLWASSPATSGHAAAGTFSCTPVGVAVFTNRVHVRCSPAAGAISYF